MTRLEELKLEKLSISQQIANNTVIIRDIQETIESDQDFVNSTIDRNSVLNCKLEVIKKEIDEAEKELEELENKTFNLGDILLLESVETSHEMRFIGIVVRTVDTISIISTNATNIFRPIKAKQDSSGWYDFTVTTKEINDNALNNYKITKIDELQYPLRHLMEHHKIDY